MTDAAVTEPPDTVAPWLAGGGEMGERIRGFDWSTTPIGSIDAWPQSLKTAVRIVLDSRYAMFVWWGRELTNLYNDAYAQVLGARHPAALGRFAPDIWADIWPVVGPQSEQVLNEGLATWNDSVLLMMERDGYLEETYFTFSYSPIPNDAGEIGGVFCACMEETDRVIGERRLRLLRDLAAANADARTEEEACARSIRALGGDRRTLPFSVLYLEGRDGIFRLAAATGIEVGNPAVPATVPEDPLRLSPLGAAFGEPDNLTTVDLRANRESLPTGAWDRPPDQAAAIPIAAPVGGRRGVLVVGLNPHRPFDEGYRDFLRLVGGQIAASLAAAQAFEDERRRAEELAALDRAKNAFFSNVSHEFRTPLTLLISPLEDILESRDGRLSDPDREGLEVARRNSRRLLRLVNTLLDFSRIEAGRVEASFEPTDIAAHTTDLASQFRSAIERAGLRLEIDAPTLSEPVYLDRSMWEKIVLNLLSNAVKSTFEGGITTRVRSDGTAAIVEIIDSGIGIPEAERSRIFERFHRIEQARSRTHEGTGIGLALVQELVRLHGGDVAVTSQVDVGTTFAVRIPLGFGHLPADRIGVEHRPIETAVDADPFVEEALTWLSGGEDEGRPAREAIDFDARGTALEPGARLLIADDNADMRRYLGRLLDRFWTVETVADGRAALDAVRTRPPDLVVADVMMPGQDGFELLHAIRADAELRDTPVILVSARAGEESRIEGLEAGADDYVVKPFSGRELVSRIGAALRMARMRRESIEALRHATERDAFRAQLDDAIRPLTDPVEIHAVAARVLGERLGASRVYYGLVEADGERLLIERDYAAGVASLAGVRRRMDDFGLAIANELRAGRTAIVDDAAADGRLDDAERAMWAAANVRSALGIPLLKGGRLVALLGVHQGAARAWAPTDVALAEDAAERIWAAVERERALGALKEAHEKYRALVWSTAESVWEADATGAIDVDSPAWRALTDQGLEEWIGFGWMTAIHPDDRARVEEEWRHGVAARMPIETEFRVRSAGGSWRWISARGSPILGDTGALRWIGMNTDVTSRKRAEEAREGFIGVLSHELRTPVTTIVGASELLTRRDRERDAATTQELTGDILVEARRLQRLVEDLLVLSRAERSQLVIETEPVLVHHAIRAAVDAEAEQHPEVRFVIEAEVLPLVLADRTYVEQALRNLLSNAAKYGAEGDPEVRVVARFEDGSITVRVLDHGPGFRPDHAGRLFELFYREAETKRRKPGAGIGLFVTRALIEAMGGSVWARPQDDHGAEFGFSLPAMQHDEDLAGTKVDPDR